MLNIQAIELLKENGFLIINETLSISLPNGGTFIPDIIAQKEDKKIYIEVERGTSKDIGFRRGKWLNFFYASGGEIYVICDNPDCMRKIRAEINRALGVQKAKVFLTNLYNLQEGQRGEGGSIWLTVKSAT